MFPFRFNVNLRELLNRAWYNGSNRVCEAGHTANSTATDREKERDNKVLTTTTKIINNIYI